MILLQTDMEKQDAVKQVLHIFDSVNAFYCTNFLLIYSFIRFLQCMHACMHMYASVYPVSP